MKTKNIDDRRLLEMLNIGGKLLYNKSGSNNDYFYYLPLLSVVCLGCLLLV